MWTTFLQFFLLYWPGLKHLVTSIIVWWFWPDLYFYSRLMVLARPLASGKVQQNPPIMPGLPCRMWYSSISGEITVSPYPSIVPSSFTRSFFKSTSKMNWLGNTENKRPGSMTKERKIGHMLVQCKWSENQKYSPETFIPIKQNRKALPPPLLSIPQIKRKSEIFTRNFYSH